MSTVETLTEFVDTHAQEAAAEIGPITGDTMDLLMRLVREVRGLRLQHQLTMAAALHHTSLTGWANAVMRTSEDDGFRMNRMIKNFYEIVNAFGYEADFPETRQFCQRMLVYAKHLKMLMPGVTISVGGMLAGCRAGVYR